MLPCVMASVLRFKMSKRLFFQESKQNVLANNIYVCSVKKLHFSDFSNENQALHWFIACHFVHQGHVNSFFTLLLNSCFYVLFLPLYSF